MRAESSAVPGAHYVSFTPGRHEDQYVQDMFPTPSFAERMEHSTVCSALEWATTRARTAQTPWRSPGA